MELKYNPEDRDSVLAYAKRLKNRTLRSMCNAEIVEHVYQGKGNFGQVLEKYYFGYVPNSLAGPDFPKIGLELKSSPLKELKKGEYRSKERLVLNIINYFNVVEQEFENSDFLKKNAKILLIFYLYQAGIDILDFPIKIVDEWDFTFTDLEVIKNDWLTIKRKVSDGKAHELSEGDTFYLGACTKGANSSSMRKQPFSVKLAKQRAFSFKQGYVNHIIASLSGHQDEKFGKLIPSLLEAKNKTIEAIVIEKFEPFYGSDIEQLVDIFYLHAINNQSKQYFSSVSTAILNKILGVPLEKNASNYLEEFNKAEIKIKTVRLKENNLPSEDLSFPTFKYCEIINESWEESGIKGALEHKFLFVFFQYDGERIVLRKVVFWNMSYSDMLEVEKVWRKTVDIVLNGNIVKRIKINKKGEERNETNFPDKKFNHVSHVRPHAKTKADTYPLPTRDKVTGLNEYTKHCFWLNSRYVRDEIFLK